METQPPSSPHIVIFPLPIQGPVNAMVKLSELILSSTTTTISITFITTHYIHHRLTTNSSAATRLAQHGPRFRFETVSDGLGPDSNRRGPVELVSMTKYMEEQAQDKNSRLREVLAKRKVSCIIGDGFYGFMVDVANELKVPLVYFDTVSPCGLWSYLCVPNMVQAGQLPFQGDDLDAPITSVPGMETYLRRRDLPSFCRTYDPESLIIQLILKEAQNFPKAQGHILNTFDELEPDYIHHLRALCPNLYNIGPLHLNLKCRVPKQDIKSSYSNSLWQEDRSCLAWLDAQSPKSVLFVSIGSLAIMTKEHLIEIWHGLINSKTKFLWTIRPGSIVGSTEAESEHPEALAKIMEETKDQGCIVSWAPQEEVLAHKAIGGFYTHSGWNSTLESIVEGVPMICWPFFVDQQVNSRLVSEVWKIGVDMKDVCDRFVIEKLVKDLMGNRRDEFFTRANELAKLATQAVAEGGSSYNDLNRLIDDITFMRLTVPRRNDV